MKKSRFSEEQIIDISKEQEAGVPVAELFRKHGMSDADSYTWKARYGGLGVSETKRLRGLEAENAKLKRLPAEAMLDNVALKDLLGKSGNTSAGFSNRFRLPEPQASSACRATGGRGVSAGGLSMSERQACRVIGVDRSSVRCQASKPDDGVLRARLKTFAQERRRFGYRRLHVLLRREGQAVNKKRVQRLDRGEADGAPA